MRERDAALADNGVVTLRQRGDELMRVGETGAAKAMLSRTLAAKRRLSCSTTLIWDRNDSRVNRRMSWPSINTCPCRVSYKRRIKLTRDDLPLPDGPTITMPCPGRTSRSMLSSTG